jgi:hypothetical protein
LLKTNTVSDVGKIYYKFTKYFVIFFYFIYSVVPSIFAIFCVINDIQVFYWLNLNKEDQIYISILQILGFGTLLLTLPKYKKSQIISNLRISIPKIIMIYLAYFFFLITIPAFVEMLIKSRSIQGRELLFDLSTQISSKYFLKIVFLILSLLVMYLVYTTKSMKYLFLLFPCVFIEFISLGRVWPFALVTLFLISYIHINEKFISSKAIIIFILLFALYSMIRLISLGGELDILGNIIFLFGESFNTQQTIELAIHSQSSLDTVHKFANIISDFIPFGLRNLIVDSEHNITGIIDSAKTSLYGAHVTMGFGSSWVSQYILFFGNNIFVILYPLFLSLSLKLYLRISKFSKLFSIIYLFYFISGLFMFFRYGLPLSLTYPLFNTCYAILLLLILKAIFGNNQKLNQNNFAFR